MDEEIDVAFGFDAGYAPHGAAVIASAVRHAPGARFRFLILHTGMPDARRAQLEATAPGHRFVWMEVHDEDLPEFGERENLGHVKKATFLRLGLETLAPQDCHRIIYLDADIIVMGDLRKLWATDLGARPIGGVPDTFIDEIAFADRWKLARQPNGYFNAGILLIDLDRVRAGNLFTKAMQFVVNENPAFADQDALNWAMWGRWKHIDNCWNVQRDMAIPALAATLPDEKRFAGGRLGIVHFTGKEKPWLAKVWHPWAWIYWDHAARTPFLEEVAVRYGVSAYQRFRMHLRWLRRRPHGAAAVF